MRKKLVAIALAVTFFVLIIVYVYNTAKDNWYQQGFNSGQLSARHEILEVLKKDFSEVNSQKEYKVVFSVKTTTVVVYKKSDIKTIGIIE